MTPEEKPAQETTGAAPRNPKSDGFIKEMGRDVGNHLLRETGTTIKWALGGAVVGAAIVGGLGLWKFGVTGLWIGAVAGAFIGGAIGAWTYLSAWG